MKKWYLLTFRFFYFWNYNARLIMEPVILFTPFYRSCSCLCVCVFVETVQTVVSNLQFHTTYITKCISTASKKERTKREKRQLEQGSVEIMANEICDNKCYRFSVHYRTRIRVRVYITGIKPNLIKYTYLFLISTREGRYRPVIEMHKQKRNNKNL